jgi:hypothetical protein
MSVEEWEAGSIIVARVVVEIDAYLAGSYPTTDYETFLLSLHLDNPLDHRAVHRYSAKQGTRPTRLDRTPSRPALLAPLRSTHHVLERQHFEAVRVSSKALWQGELCHLEAEAHPCLNTHSIELVHRPQHQGPCGRLARHLDGSRQPDCGSHPCK